MSKVKIKASGDNGCGWLGDVRYVSNGKPVPGYYSDCFGAREGALKHAFLWAQAEGHEIVGYDLVKNGAYYDVVPKVTR